MILPEMNGIPVSNSVLITAFAFSGLNAKGSPEIVSGLTPVDEIGFYCKEPKTIGLAAAVNDLWEHC